jgi:outer membrane protein
MRTGSGILSVAAGISAGLVAVNLLVAAPAWSADKAVYVVDMQRVINESLAGKAARSNLEADAKKREVVLDRSRQELTKLQEDLAKQGSLLSASALEEKRQMFAKKERDFGRLLQDQRAEMAKRQEVEMAKVIKEIDAVIAAIGANGDYPFIIEKDPRLVLHATERLDLTGEVVKELNAKKVGL